MKVLDEASKAVESGASLSLEELGLPVEAHNGLLIVFWKEQ